MKPIVISLILLIAVTLSTVIAGASVTNSLDKLIEQTKALPDLPDSNTVQSLELIEKNWNSRKELYSAVIKFDFIYNFSKELSSAKAGCIADDPGTYLASKNALINLLEYIRDVQKFRLDNLI